MWTEVTTRAGHRAWAAWDPEQADDGAVVMLEHGPEWVRPWIASAFGPRTREGFGVTPEEARPGRPPFVGHSAVNFRAGLFAFFNINMRIRLTGLIRAQRLDNEIFDSPIVDENRGFFGLVGLTYRFGELPPRPGS